MPWSKVDGSDVEECTAGQIAVVKDEDGTVEGCHNTEEQADEQLAALNASESDRSVTDAQDLPDDVRRAIENGETLYRSVPVEVERDGEEGEPIVMRFSDESVVDRHGTNFELDGADMQAFRQNPIVRWAHGKDPQRGRLPIARATSLTRQNGELVATLDFYDDDDFARQVESMLREGYLNTGSIAAGPTGSPEMRTVNGEEVVTFTDWELRGLSVVDIPSDPNATAVSRDDQRSGLERRLERLERMVVNGADIDEDAEERAVSVGELRSEVRSSVYDMDGPQESWFVKEVMVGSIAESTASGSVIAHENESDTFYSIAFNYDGEEVSLQDRESWSEVQAVWEEVPNEERSVKDEMVSDSNGSNPEDADPLTRKEAIRAATTAVAKLYARQTRKRKKQKKEFRQSLKRQLGKA